MSEPFLSVVIPSYNEISNLQKGVLNSVLSFLNKQEYNFEVIIVDDGSTDGSVEFIQKFAKDNRNFKLIKNPHLGKAGAVTSGILKAKGSYILFSDMDQATPIKEIDKLLPYFRVDKSYDIVIGSRNSQRRGAPWTRHLMAQGMIFLRRLIVGVKEVSDTQCGFKMFRREAAKDIFTKINALHKGFRKISGSSVSAGFDVELLYLASKLGFKIKEVPVNWFYVETRRVSPVIDSIEGLLDLFKIKINDIKGAYS